MIKSTKGSTTVLFAFAFTAVVAATALVIDIGTIVLEKSRLSSAVDAAALAGAQELAAQSGNAVQVAEQYLQKNVTPLKQQNITIDTAARTIEVRGEKTVNNFIMGFFGKDSEDISAHAKAKVENITSLKGVRPLAVINQTFSFGTQYTLKEGAGDGTSGNYAAIAIGNTGASTYRDNLLYGSNITLSRNDLIQTETGNIAGTTETSINQLINSCNDIPPCTFESYNTSCSRIIFVPVVDTLDINGRKYIKVLGFATFFLEGVTNHGGQADVTGRFISYNAQGETSTAANDYGTYNIKLVR